MKYFSLAIFGFYFVFSASAIALTYAGPDDVIIQSHLDQKSTNWLIDKTRLILSNVDVSDGLTATVPLLEEPMIPLTDLGDTPQFRHLRQLVKEVFHVDFQNAAFRIRIPKIYYRVGSLRAKPTSLVVNDPVLSLQASAAILGFDISLLEGVQVDLMLLNPRTQKLESYLTGSVKPVAVKIPETLPAAEFSLGLEATRDQGFTFKLKNYDLDPLPIYVKKHFRSFSVTMAGNGRPLSAQEISVNPVVVKLSGMSRSISFDDFRPLVQRKLDTILGRVLTTVGNSLKSTIGPRILTQVFSTQTRSDFGLVGVNIYSHFSAVRFSQPAANQLNFDIGSDLCTKILYDQYGIACVDHTSSIEQIRAISDDDRAKARAEISAKIADGKADVAVSISEEYINRVLKTTIDARLWDEMLSENNLSLGPKGAFMVFNQATKTPDIYLDLTYSGSGRGVERIFINGRRPIRFPLRMSSSLHFEIRAGEPFLVVKTEKLQSDADEIINGLPEYGLDSDLVWGLRRKIAGMIINMAATLEGQTAVELELPMFKDLGLETVTSETSAFGRLNLYFKI
ncbi:MAG: hypothetical protein H7333_06055 [Bdellovibrionales bacterium]|nr:hypothetical protein [Oligoflexia bacterium]